MSVYVTYQTPFTVITDALAELLRESSVLTRLRTTGVTPLKEHGNEMAENTFQSLVDCEIDETEFNSLTAGVTPFWVDDEFAFYQIPSTGVILVGPAPEEEAAPVQSCCDRAVIEAGFATEPLRHLVSELYGMLYLRMLRDPVRGFSDAEWEACQEARRALGLIPAYRGEAPKG